MAKKIVWALLLMVSYLQAQKIQWIHTFPKASKAAQEQAKPIFFVLTITNNDLTKKIEQDTVAVKLISKNFIPFVSYQDKSDFVPQSLYKPDVNSLWFLSPVGNPLYQQQSTVGHVYFQDLDNALVIVTKDMQARKEQARLERTPYEFHANFKFYTDLQEAEKVAKKTKKPIFMLVGRTSCQYCRKLKKDVLYDPEVLKTIEKNYILVVKDARFSIPYKYHTPGIPAIWFLDENGNALSQPFVGFVPKERLLQAIKPKK